MSRPHPMLYTKRQLELVMAGWGCTEPVPKAGQNLYVCFAGQFIDLAVVEKTTLKSDCKELLWRVTTSSRAGREFDALVQEAHVVAYRIDRSDQHRRDCLARYNAMQASAA